MYILQKYQLDQINYIDSDLYFFDDPKKIINFLGDNSIILIEHGIKTKRFGKYNVGWLTFKNDEISRNCLEEWSKNCINWCYDYVEDDKYEYLNINNISIIRHRAPTCFEGPGIRK